MGTGRPDGWAGGRSGVAGRFDEDQGQRATVGSPADAPRDAGDAGSPARPVRAAPPGARRILIVDDNIDAGETLGILLRDSGSEVCVVHDGTSALDEAAAFVPDVVLLDIGLPGMDGFEVARRLREIPGLESALFVAVSGYALDEHRREATEAGIDRYFTKPVGIKALRELLATLPPPAE